MIAPLLLTAALLTQAPTTSPTPPAEAKATTPAPTAPTLSELHAAQVDAHLSKLRALQAEVQLQQIALTQQRDKINAAIAAAYPGFTLDWDRGVLVPATKATGKDDGK